MPCAQDIAFLRFLCRLSESARRCRGICCFNRPFDDQASLHVACAIEARCDAFLTTDKGILERSGQIDTTRILDPVQLIQEMSP
jgi:predicted nucleic acid-binding protein